MNFGELLDRFKGVKALVIGDFMLDEYIFGRATRISPEAPVMVVHHQKTTRLPGGAANVALNLLALGAETHAIGVAGGDSAGDLLQDSLHEQGLTHVDLIRDADRSTTRKTRVIAGQSHQVLRIDHEDDNELSHSMEGQLLQATLGALDRADVVVLSDYLKGALTEGVTSKLIEQARNAGKTVVANPKPRSLKNYRGASLVSLNRAEASEALGMHRGLSDSAALEGARSLRESFGLEGMLVTLGESGMAASGPSDWFVKAPTVEVYDTAGAGDTVVATAALGVTVAGFAEEVFQLAVQTSACVVRHVGVATPSAADIEQIRSSQVS